MVLIANSQLTYFKCSTPVNEFPLTGLAPHHLCQGFSVMSSSVPASSRQLSPTLIPGSALLTYTCCKPGSWKGR